MTDTNTPQYPETVLEGLREFLGIAPGEPIVTQPVRIVTEVPTEDVVNEPVVVEATAEAVAEADDDSVIEKTAHAVAKPVHAIGRGIRGFYHTTEAKVRRTNDIRRGRRAMSDASRKMMRQLGEQQRAAEAAKAKTKADA